MLTYLGGQTIFDNESNNPVLFLGTILLKQKDDNGEIFYCIYNGKDIVNVDGTELSHIFTSDPHLLNRKMYYGNYCKFKVTEDLDEDVVLANKTKINSHLKEVSKLVKDKKLFLIKRRG